MLTVTTVAPTRRLTSVAAVVAELGTTLTPTEQAILAGIIDGVTSAIEGFCEAPSFAREVVEETLPGFGDLTVELTRRPVISVSLMTVDAAVITDFSIQDADKGEIYRQAGFDWTAQSRFSLTGRQTWPAMGHPVPGREEPLIGATYVGGYILPEQFLSDAALSVVAADQSFNGSAGMFPALLKPGDILIASGFASSANNGRFVVSSATPPTTSKVVATGAALVNESSATRSIRFDAPAHCRSFAGLERAAIIASRASWLTRADDPDVIERQVAQLRTRKSEGFNEDPLLAIPGEAIGYLRPWMRSA